MFDHDVRVLLLEVLKSAFGFGIAAAPITALFLRRRGKQNRKLAAHLAEEVTVIRGQVRLVREGLDRNQAVIAVHTDKLNDTNARIACLTLKIDEIEHLLPELENVMRGVRSYFEKAKLAAVHFKQDPGDKKS